MPPHMDDDDWFNGVHDDMDKVAKELHEGADRLLDRVEKEINRGFKDSSDGDFVFELKINSVPYSDNVREFWRNAIVWAKTPKPSPAKRGSSNHCTSCGKNSLLFEKQAVGNEGGGYFNHPAECFYCGPVTVEDGKIVALKDRTILTEVLPQQRTAHYRTGLIHRVKLLPTKRVMTQQTKRYMAASLLFTLLMTPFSPIPWLTAVCGIATALALRHLRWTVKVPK